MVEPALRARRRVVRGVACYAVAVLVAVVVVDVFGVGAELAARDRAATLWFLLFEEGSPTEWVQALLLLGVVLYAGVGAAAAGERGDGGAARLLMLLGVSASLLLLEDTGNIGQWFGRWARLLGARSGMADELVRLPFLAAVAAVPTYALIRHRAVLARHPSARRWIWGGFLTYAFMGLTGEALQAVLPVYRVVGRFLLSTLLRGALDPAQPDAFWAPAEIVFMDYVYEEGLELLAATLLLGGVLTLRWPRQDAEPASPAAQAA